MNPSDRTKEALIARSELLCAAIHDDTTNAKNSSGGTSYLSKILHAVKLEDTSAYAAVPTLGPANDYYTSAQRELTIREQSAGLIKTTRDLSTLIRDLQELWLFGGLDTLSDPADEEASREKAGKVAGMIEVLARSAPVGKEGDGEEKKV